MPRLTRLQSIVKLGPMNCVPILSAVRRRVIRKVLEVRRVQSELVEWGERHSLKDRSICLEQLQRNFRDVRGDSGSAAALWWVADHREPEGLVFARTGLSAEFTVESCQRGQPVNVGRAGRVIAIRCWISMRIRPPQRGAPKDIAVRRQLKNEVG